MKNTVFTLIGFIFLVFISCNNQEEEKQISAKEYNDNMITIQKEADKAIVDVIEAIYEIDHDKMDKNLSDGLELMKTSIKKVEEIDGSFDSGNYKSHMIKLLNAYHSVLEEEFAGIIEIYALPDEEYTEEHKNQVSILFDKALTKYSIAIADFRDFQERFAKAHHLEFKQ